MTKLLKATAITLILSASASLAQVTEYDVPYVSKWEHEPSVSPVKECRLLGFLPCHEGFDYVESESDSDLPQSKPKPEPQPTPECVNG